jgi:SHS2 domain-containing protein
MKKMPKYKYLIHTADIKFQAFGKSKEECFSNAAYALTNIISKEKIKCLIKKEIKVKGDDIENLLYNFLEEFLYLLDSKNFLLGDVQNIFIINVISKKYELKASVFGDYTKNYEIEGSVKAITYNDMFVRQEKKEWICQVVVDV